MRIYVKRNCSRSTNYQEPMVFPPVYLHIMDQHGLVNFTLSSPQGMVTGNQYNGMDKVLGRHSGKPEHRGGKCGISIMLRGCSGFSSYGIFEHQEGCPDVNIYQGSIVFKLEERLFRHMAVSDERQGSCQQPRTT